MSKRLCPFEENFGRQLKTHISEKDLGNENNNVLKVIHSKTLQKLYNGAKKQSNKNNTTVCINCHGDLNLTAKCWFCEHWLCSNCLQTCNSCKELFCRNCSIEVYEKMNGIICLTCAK